MESIFLDSPLFKKGNYKVSKVLKSLGDYAYKDEVIVVLETSDNSTSLVFAPFNLSIDTVFVYVNDSIKFDHLLFVVNDLSNSNDFDDKAFENNLSNLRNMEITILKDDFDDNVICDFKNIGNNFLIEKYIYFNIYEVNSLPTKRALEFCGITFKSENGNPFILFLIPQAGFPVPKGTEIIFLFEGGIKLIYRLKFSMHDELTADAMNIFLKNNLIKVRVAGSYVFALAIIHLDCTYKTEKQGQFMLRFMMASFIKANLECKALIG